MIGFSQFQNHHVQDQAPVGDHGTKRRLMVRSMATVAVIIATIGVIPAAAQTAAPTSAPKPVIQAKLAGSPLPGVPGSYCWPQPGQSPCALVEDPKPTTFVPANPGDVITFSLNPAGDPLASLIATFLDDAQADGKPLQIDLTSSQDAYTVDTALTSGPHRIEIDAAYPAMADGSQNYVAYVFGIQISGPAAAATVAVDGATTAIAIVPTVVVAAPVSATTAATSAATPVAATSTQLPTATSTSTNTLTNTPSPTATNTLTDTPTDTPTNTPSPTATETWTPSPTYTATVTPSVTPTSTGIALGNGLNVPKLALMVGTQSYEPVAITASIQDDTGALITVTRPNNASSPFVHATGGAVIQLQFSGPKPVSELASLQTGDATVLISQQVIPPETTTLYTVPTKAGLYTLSIAVQWAQGSATYVFHVQISG
jgi:hypothetical protein